MHAPVALITGGLGDLAQALHVELTGQGYTVHAPGRTEMDVTSSASVDAFVSGMEALDLLVCNAGVCRDGGMLKMEELDFDQVLDTCLSGAFRAARAALKRMSRQRRGHIVFIGSFSGWRGPAGQANYAAAKSGLLALTQSLAAEYGARNIRVNCVLPGFMETRMTAGLGEELKKTFLAAHTLGRFNTPQEVGRFIVHLDRFLPHTSGQIFNLDSRLHRSA
jgi:NAD(P)-dependent dehydrogenase (short-subunit alcohol dehydrogenase family)